MNRIFLGLAFLAASLFGAVEARNGIAISTASTINGITPVGAVNGIAVVTGVDPDVQNYLDQIAIAGGTIDGTATAAITVFVSGCKADGIWDRLVDVGPLCGDQLAAALVKLKTGSGSWTYTNNSFVGGDYSQATGLTGGTGRTLGTGMQADSLPASSSGLAVYNRSSPAGSANLQGAINPGDSSNRLQIQFPHADGNAYIVMYTTGTELNGGAISGAVGLMHASRVVGGQIYIFRNGTQLATDFGGGTLPPEEIAWFGYKFTTFNPACSYTQSFLAVCLAMDPAEAALLYTHVQALQVALGRNV